VNQDKIIFAICVVVGLFGFSWVMERQSIASIIIGFLVVAAAVVVGTVYLTKLRHPKNPMQDEIDALIEKDKFDKNGKS
jgi:hypothetical protein